MKGSVDNKNSLSAYEILRNENIRRNNEFCASLGLQDVKKSIDETLSYKKKEKRISKRPISPSSSLTAMKQQQKGPARRSERIKIGNTTTKTTVEEEEENSIFAAAESPRFKSRTLTIDEYSENMQNLSRFPSFNKSVTPNQITKLIFHPTASQDPILFAGDKEGFLCIWNAKNEFLSGDLEADQIIKKKPHKSKINNLYIGNDENKLFSVSNDGDVQRFDLATEKFTTEYSSDLDDFYIRRMFVDSSFSLMHKSCLYVGKSDGNLSLIDFRASNDKFQWDHKVQNEKINSVQEHPVLNHLIITAGAGKKGMICIHDIRSLGENKRNALVSIDNQNSESSYSANVSPDGQFLLSVSLNNELRTWKSFCDPNMFSLVAAKKSKDVKYLLLIIIIFLFLLFVYFDDQ
jgi:WD40 repeat protein